MTNPPHGFATNGDHPTPVPSYSAPVPPQQPTPAAAQAPAYQQPASYQQPAQHVDPAHVAPAAAYAPASSPSLRVRVRRTDGAPVVSAAVTLLESNGGQVSRADSDGHGVAEFPALPGGELLLVVRHKGYLPQARTVLLHQPPAPTLEVEVVVPGASRLSGTVTTGTGRPVEGALVTLTGVDGAVAASSRTDAAGTYGFVDLTVEEGTLAVFAPSARPIAVPVTVPPGTRGRQDVEVRGSGVVSGVAQTPEGWLIADARVSLHRGGVEVAVTRTDSDGAYSFPGLDAGTYTVIAVGYPPAQTEVVAGNGETTVAPITLAHED